MDKKATVTEVNYLTQVEAVIESMFHAQQQQTLTQQKIARLTETLDAESINCIETDTLTAAHLAVLQQQLTLHEAKLKHLFHQVMDAQNAEL